MKKVDFEDKLPLTEHLEELRWRLLWAALAIFFGFSVCYAFNDHIIGVLQSPLPIKYKKLTFLAPTEAFLTVLKVSFFSGIFLAFPVVFYQVWCFACPALLEKEKKYAGGVIVSGTFFFIVGILFAYCIVLPLGLKFLLTYGEKFGTPNITISHYLSFTIKFILGFGLIFELPLVIAFLAKSGIVTSETLKKNRGICVVIIFVISAILTPPDVVTQVLMAFPLWLLLEFSIYVAKFFEKKQEDKRG